LAARHEWVKTHEESTDEQYQPYFDHFNPDCYDPWEWARAAKAAGVKYVVLTATMTILPVWDSALTEYNVRHPSHRTEWWGGKGPTARGSLDPRARTALAEIDGWMDAHARFIHGCGPAWFTAPADCRYTRRPTGTNFDAATARPAS
jgi:alpha-L-fucosidase